MANTTTMATTILNITIPKNTHMLSGNPSLVIADDREFPQKIYETNPPYIKNPYYDKSFHQPTNDIRSRRFLFPILRLELISYDKASDYYEFRLSVPKIGLGMPIPADVYFTKTNQQSIILAGKFKPVSEKEQQRPPIDENSPDDFILSVDSLKYITISTQHDIPLTLKLHD